MNGDSEATQAWPASGLLGGGRQPTALGMELASEKACPGTLWRNLEAALCSIGKKYSPTPTHRELVAGSWAWGFRTQAKQLMGLLEAVRCGVSQSAELAGSRPNQRKTDTACKEEAGGGPDHSPLHPPWTFSSPPPQLRTQTPGIRLQAIQKTPSSVSWADVFPPKFICRSPKPQYLRMR